ncbi:enamine deaminase RidA [Gammaproteobacteria bacterium 45_16_T64]|nr:enamine deaminase RidA [Gammaproteobacteria bacterium 45_16_T64]
MSVERKNYIGLDDPVGPYMHAVKHGDVLYTSGMTAFGTAAQKQGVEAQTEEIFRQLAAILNAENNGLEQLIKVTLFVTDLALIGELRETLFSLYGENIPASSVVEVSRLFSPDIKIEIEAIAALS